MNLQTLKANNQNKLFNYNNLFLNVVNLYNNKKLPNKIIFSGPKGIGKSTFAYHLLNYIFSKNEEFNYNLSNFEINTLNKSYNLVLNNSHPNFHLIDLTDNKNVIEISQIREMINYANKSSFNSKERIILIDNSEYLNLNSSNALLKIIEEPNENVIFILISDNSKSLLETIKSRCLRFNFSMSHEECLNITNKIIQNDLLNIINKDLINHYNTVGDFINLINFSTSSKINISEISLKNFLISLIDEKFYKNELFIKKNIYKYIEFYFLKLIKLDKFDKKKFFIYENFIKKIHNLKKFNLDEESFFIELKTKVLNG